MNARHILFRTNRFNLSAVKPHFINTCCFGEDSATWLGGRLAGKSIKASPPGQEDWGWHLRASCGRISYFLAMSGIADDKSNSKNAGEWRIIVQKKRSLWERITGQGKIHEDGPLLNLILGILRSNPDFQNIRVES